MKRRSALPVLVALLVGSATAGAATMLARPLDEPQSGERVVFGASFTNAERPPGPGRPAASRSANSAPSTSSSTTAAPTTTAPAMSSSPARTPAPTKTPPPPTRTTAPTRPAPAPPDQTEQVVQLVNEARAERGCDPLRVDASLTAAASTHSSDMSERDYFSHTTPEGVTFDERIKAAGYPLPGAENIARGQRSAKQVMDAWMDSSGHRANILNCQLTAIGVALDADGFYWTQDFGY